jgi:orotidine-5'-phosphate decarboxylase
MQRQLSLSESLIVSADFDPNDAPVERPQRGVYYAKKRDWVRSQVLRLSDKIHSTGVYLKVNSALRACGYGIIDEIHARGLPVFADLKLFDIPTTLATDGIFLREARPELLTVVISAGLTGLKELKAQLPESEVLGVTVLTSHKERDTRVLFKSSVDDTVLRLGGVAIAAKLDGLVCAPKEARMMQQYCKRRFSINTPGIRFRGELFTNDDQNADRVMTPAQAIRAGVDRIIMGRSVTSAISPLDIVNRVLDEITLARAGL